MNIGYSDNFYDRLWSFVNLSFCSVFVFLHKYYRRKINIIVVCNILSIIQNLAFLVVFSFITHMFIMFTSVIFSLINSIDIFFLKNIIESTPEIVIENEKIDFEEVFEMTENCIICLCEEGTFVSIKCKHKFHQPCIEEWIKQKRECPICRIKL